jgi:multidrug resistance efflux pump
VQPYRRVEAGPRRRDHRRTTFTEGAVVSGRQILYKLDPTRYDAAYRARRRLGNAKRTVAQLEPLIPKHAVAQQDVDNAHRSQSASLGRRQKDLDDCVIRAEINGQVGRARRSSARV